MAIIILKTQDNIGQCCLLWGDKNDPVMTMIPEIQSGVLFWVYSSDPWANSICGGEVGARQGKTSCLFSRVLDPRKALIAYCSWRFWEDTVTSHSMIRSSSKQVYQMLYFCFCEPSVHACMQLHVCVRLCVGLSVSMCIYTCTDVFLSMETRLKTCVMELSQNNLR